MKRLGFVLVTVSGGLGLIVAVGQPGVIGLIGAGLVAVFTVGSFMAARD